MAQTAGKVLWVTEHFPPNRGGMAQSCDRIVRGLRGRGTEIDVLHLRGHEAQFKTRRQVHGRYYSRPMDSDYTHSLNRIWNELEGEVFCMVFAFGGLLATQAASLYAAWLGAPLVILFRGNDFDCGIFSLKNSPVIQDALRRATAACVVDCSKQSRLKALYPGLEVVYTPNGIELEDWQVASSERDFAQCWRAKQVEDERPVWGLFGQLKKKKGGLFFLQNLRRTGISKRIHLLVTGDLSEEISDYLAANGSEFNWTQLPFLDRYELVRYYACCDWVAIPSFYDGMPNVMLEAGALGVPLIAAEVGGMRDCLRDGETSVLFAPGNPQDCREAIIRAWEMPAKGRQEMSERVSALVREQYDHTHELEVFERVINQLLDNEEKEACSDAQKL